MKFKAFLISSTSFLCYALFAQTIGHQGFKSFEHENIGCPINSLCSKRSGLLIQEWEKLLASKNSSAKTKKLQKFFNNNGAPTRFLAKKSLQDKKDVVLNSSRCKAHNPKNANNALYKGLAFSQKIEKNPQMLFDKIHLFETDKKITTYYASYGARPLFIKENRLFFLEDFDNELYQISLSVDGGLKLENLPTRLFSQAQGKRIKEIKCPKEKKQKEDRYLSSYCQKIWDIDSNKMKTIQVFWSCP